MWALKEVYSLVVVVVVVVVVVMLIVVVAVVVIDTNHDMYQILSLQ